jgi:hypothetical protein
MAGIFKAVSRSFSSNQSISAIPPSRRDMLPTCTRPLTVRPGGPRRLPVLIKTVYRTAASQHSPPSLRSLEIALTNNPLSLKKNYRDFNMDASA